MNKVSAVICELNPMHRGHSYIFEKARERGDTVVAVMSGNFVQRGECAVSDKYTRASAALSGADLVLELPFPWCTASAEFFARAAVSVAECVGADSLVFGSHCGDTAAIVRAAEILNSDSYQSAFRTMKTAAGLRRETILRELCSDLPESVYSSPNDILGSEYCRFTRRAAPYAIKRIDCPSASEIRVKMTDKDADTSKLSELEFCCLRSMKCAPLAAECGGGVGERLYNSAFGATDAKEMFALAATKQYTNARLRRAALFALAGVTFADISDNPAYTSVLATNARGRELLSKLRGNTDISILSNPSDSGKLSGRAAAQHRLSAFADTLFTLCMNKATPSDTFMKKNPIIR